jgi:hypothetical protein
MDLDPGFRLDDAGGDLDQAQSSVSNCMTCQEELVGITRRSDQSRQ